MALGQKDESYAAFQNQNNIKDKDNALDPKGDSSNNGDLESDNTKGRTVGDKTVGNRIAPVLPHLRGYDFGDDTSIAGSDILGKQIELEADSAIQYRTCSWQKVRYIILRIFVAFWDLLGCIGGVVDPKYKNTRSPLEYGHQQYPFPTNQRKFPETRFVFIWNDSLTNIHRLRHCCSRNTSVWQSCPSHGHIIFSDLCQVSS